MEKHTKIMQGINTEIGLPGLTAIMGKCREMMRRIDTKSLFQAHEIPNKVKLVFDLLLQAWSQAYAGRKFGILCVKNGMPHTGKMDPIQLGNETFLIHITGSLMKPNLPQYPLREIKTNLAGYESHIVEIVKKPQIGSHVAELSDYTRQKDTFLYMGLQ